MLTRRGGDYRRIMANHPRGSSAALTFPLLLCLTILAGCVSDQGSADDPREAGEERQPAVATYSCGEDGGIIIENKGDSVVVAATSSGEEAPDPVELPAAPADQRSRYAASIYALLLEGREAMWIAGREPPMTCTR
ncbi:MAG: hypothetical protein K5872_15630 [Rhizobiaceae bacterium]|nr:hypothetical protein [Rhizobiaceae bacterium]MCV0407654.1 hypothetical protein [Rhizobiaceae bacterium]